MNHKNITQMKLEAEKQFVDRGHTASLVLNNDRYLSIDWRRGDGLGDYYVNYLVDKDAGSLIVTGDLGNSIACWYNELDPENLSHFLGDVSYYVGKMRATSDQYTFDVDDIADDMENDIRYWNEDGEVPEDEMAEDIEYLRSEVPEHLINDTLFIDCFMEERLQKYNVDYWEYVSSWGKYIAFRPVLWAVGYQMAMRQLKKEKLI